MLASVLPGLRDLRVPLATGFLWLAIVWLVVYPILPTKDEAVGLASAAYTIFGALGPAAFVAAVTFAAYLIGILLARPGTMVARAALGWRGWHRPLSAPSEVESRQIAVRVALDMVEVGARLPRMGNSHDLVRFTSARGRSGIDASSDEALKESHDIADELVDSMRREVPLVATRLLADNRDLFDRYDRAEAESAFRLSVVLPLVVLSLLVPIRFGFEWWVCLLFVFTGLVIAFILVFEGSRKETESNDAIYQAVFAGKAEFPSVETARAAISQTKETDAQQAALKNAREEERRAAVRIEDDAARAEYAKAETAARRVEIRIRGAAAQGGPADLQLTSVHVDLQNDNDRAVLIERFEFDPPLTATKYPQFPIRVSANDVQSMIVPIELLSVTAGELSGAPLTNHTASVVYRLDGRRWTRSSDENSIPTAEKP